MSHYRSGPQLPGIAFITGGGRGLGLAIAQSFAKEGSRGIVIFDVHPPEVLARAAESVQKFQPEGGKTITFQGDVTVEADLERAVAETVSTFGRLDYCANFAGIIGPAGPVWELDAEQVKKVLEVNSVGVWLSMKVQLKQMMKQSSIEGIEEGRPEQKGAIVNCASGNSLLGQAGTAGYTASKHAVAGFTKSAALEARAAGIRVNCLSPGLLMTNLFDPLMPPGVQAEQLAEDESWKRFVSRQGRKARPEEIGDVVAMMCSPKMSFVVGHNMVVDGGFTINMGHS